MLRLRRRRVRRLAAVIPTILVFLYIDGADDDVWTKNIAQNHRPEDLKFPVGFVGLAAVMAVTYRLRSKNERPAGWWHKELQKLVLRRRVTGLKGFLDYKAHSFYTRDELLQARLLLEKTKTNNLLDM